MIQGAFSTPPGGGLFLAVHPHRALEKAQPAHPRSTIGAAPNFKARLSAIGAKGDLTADRLDAKGLQEIVASLAAVRASIPTWSTGSRCRSLP